MIPGAAGQDLKVCVVRGKANKDTKKMCAFINNYDKSGLMFNNAAGLENRWTSRIASQFEVVFFSIEHKLGPGFDKYEKFVKFQAQQDAVAAVKYLRQNASKHNIDENQLSMIGMETGGWITMGASILLSREENESNFLKTIFLVSPLLDY